MTVRRLIWVKSAHRHGWACSACAWAFEDDDPPHGDTIDEMARNYERKRDTAFEQHVCSQHPKGENKGPKGKGEER